MSSCFVPCFLPLLVRVFFALSVARFVYLSLPAMLMDSRAKRLKSILKRANGSPWPGEPRSGVTSSRETGNLLQTPQPCTNLATFQKSHKSSNPSTFSQLHILLTTPQPSTNPATFQKPHNQPETGNRLETRNLLQTPQPPRNKQPSRNHTAF